MVHVCTYLNPEHITKLILVNMLFNLIVKELFAGLKHQVVEKGDILCPPSQLGQVDKRAQVLSKRIALEGLCWIVGHASSFVLEQLET